MGLFHLCWLLSTFFLPMQIVLFITCVLLLPVYTFEFIMIYGVRVPLVRQYVPIYKTYGKDFDFKMESPVTEQFLYFSILALLYLCVGCFKLTFSFNADKSWI